MVILKILGNCWMVGVHIKEQRDKSPPCISEICISSAERF